MGVRRTFAGFAALSNAFGRNEITYSVSGAVNASLPPGPTLVGVNPTWFYAGNSHSSSLDNSNRGCFLYNPNQFGFNGAYCFTRLAVTL